jgi:hypothetical protein
MLAVSRRLNPVDLILGKVLTKTQNSLLVKLSKLEYGLTSLTSPHEIAVMLRERPLLERAKSLKDLLSLFTQYAVPTSLIDRYLNSKVGVTLTKLATEVEAWALYLRIQEAVSPVEGYLRAIQKIDPQTFPSLAGLIQPLYKEVLSSNSAAARELATSIESLTDALSLGGLGRQLKRRLSPLGSLISRFQSPKNPDTLLKQGLTTEAMRPLDVEELKYRLAKVIGKYKDIISELQTINDNSASLFSFEASNKNDSYRIYFCGKDSFFSYVDLAFALRDYLNASIAENGLLKDNLSVSLIRLKDNSLTLKVIFTNGEKLSRQNKEELLSELRQELKLSGNSLAVK